MHDRLVTKPFHYKYIGFDRHHDSPGQPETSKRAQESPKRAQDSLSVLRTGFRNVGLYKSLEPMKEPEGLVHLASLLGLWLSASSSSGY